MLGDQIGEIAGAVTAFRVIPGGMGVKVESMFQGQGQVLGNDVYDYATYTSEVRPDGKFSGVANGVMFTMDAQAAMYSGQGIGWMLGRGGAAQWRGSLFYLTMSPGLSALNEAAILFEFEIEEDAKQMTIKLWEWK
jgi:hypothetical protein